MKKLLFILSALAALSASGQGIIQGKEYKFNPKTNPPFLAFTNDSNVLVVERSTGKFRRTSVGSAITPVTGCYELLRGGIVTWSGSGLIMDVSPAYYVIGCNFYQTTQAQVTLSAAHATLGRIDVIAVNTSSQVVVITGTPAATPIKPQVDVATQLELTYISVPAAATTPGAITQTIIYNENTEWTSSSSLTAGTVDFNSTSNPFIGAKNAVLSSTATGNIFWTNSTPLNFGNYQALKLYVRLDASSPTHVIGAYLTLAGAYLTPGLNLLDYNYSNTTSGSYQVITIPMAAFQNSGGSTFDGVAFRVSAAATTVHIDYVQSQGGLATQSEGTILPGLDKQVAYYSGNGRTLAPAAGFEIGNTNQRAKISSQSATEVPLTLQGAASQSANLLDIKNSSGTTLARFIATGALGVQADPALVYYSAPGDFRLVLEGGVGIAESNLLYSYWSKASGRMQFVARNNSGTNTVFFDVGGDSYFNGGNLGIGTTTPTAKLSVGSTSDFQVNSSGKVAKYANSAITNGQLLIGHTTNGTFEKAALTAGQNISIANGAGSVTISTDITLAQGTYTPTLTNTTNITSSTAYTTHYFRIGDQITVWGQVEITPAAVGAVELRISLPVLTSNFVNTYDAAGNASEGTQDGAKISNARILAVTSAGTVKLLYNDQIGGSRTFSFSFTYKYIAP